VRVLIVKTSSMGDVVHALPALSDMVRQVPGLRADWLVEAPFAAIPALHPAVQQVMPLAWRKWRKRLFDRATWQAMGQLRQQLRREPYDLVLDMQGLLKSVVWGGLARGPLVGYERPGIRDPFASRFYSRKVYVPWEMQAVERCRRLAAAHLGYALPGSAPDFGIQAPPPGWAPPAAFSVLIPCASRPEKLWPNRDWMAVGQHLAAQGTAPVVLWGSEAERRMAETIAHGCGGVVPPFLSVKDTAAVLGRAAIVVGLDTGFSHLGAALGRSTIGIYCDHEPGLAGITGSGPVASIGGKGQVPSLDAVLRLVQQVQSSSIRTGG
jgi:heptosyltransferase I